jgi:hypothetical protein
MIGLIGKKRGRWSTWHLTVKLRGRPKSHRQDAVSLLTCVLPSNGEAAGSGDYASRPPPTIVIRRGWLGTRKQLCLPHH